jgi:hypothetical protein
MRWHDSEKRQPYAKRLMEAASEMRSAVELSPLQIRALVFRAAVSRARTLGILEGLAYGIVAGVGGLWVLLNL